MAWRRHHQDHSERGSIAGHDRLTLRASQTGIAPTALARDLASRVHTATLDNGVRIILLEQRAAPVVSFDLMFTVGGVDEPPARC